VPAIDASERATTRGTLRTNTATCQSVLNTACRWPARVTQRAAMSGAANEALVERSKCVEFHASVTMLSKDQHAGRASA